MRIFLVSLDKTILSVKQLLTLPNLGIPAYQRPYKWTQKNLNLLFNDLREYRDKSAYRLGSVVFHQHSDQEKMQLDIVDGQQRTLTLGEFKHEVRQFEKSYDNQQAEQISLMV